MNNIARISSRLSLSNSKQGNPNLLTILSSTFHSSIQHKYEFEDIKNSLQNSNSHNLKFKNIKNPFKYIDKPISQRPFYTLKDINTIDDAVSVFDRMLETDPMPPMVVFNRVLDVVLKMKQYSECVLMFKKLILLRFPVDEFTMSILVSCYCYMKEVNLGFAIVASFLKLGYAPDIASINGLIKGIILEAKEADKGVSKNRWVDDVMMLLSKMNEEGVTPNEATYTTLIIGFCDHGRLGEANELVRQMVDNKMHPTITTFGVLLKCYCKKGLMKNAERLVELMTEIGVEPNVVTYTILMGGYCSKGQLDEAERVLKLMVEKGEEPNLVSYGTIINGYCKNERIDSAWEMFKELSVKGLKPNTVLYSCMIQGLFSVGRCSDALELFDEMKIAGLPYNSYTYNNVLVGLMNNGKLEDAIIFYHEVDSQGLAKNVSFYSTFIHGLCNNNQLDLARSVYNDLSLKGLSPNVITYNVMMKGLCQEGMFQEVNELLDQMENSGLSPSDVTYNTIIQGCLKHYDSFDSLNLLRRIGEKDFSLHACTLSLVLEKMQGSDVHLEIKNLIQKLMSLDHTSYGVRYQKEFAKSYK